MPSSASPGVPWRTLPAAVWGSRSLTTGLLFGALAIAFTAAAQDAAVPYDRIEEDWEIVVTEPDPDTHAPQLINVMSPTGDLSEDYGVLELNHCTQPEYVEGGLQLQFWSDEEYQLNYTPQPSLLLAIPAETIRYTVAMSIENGHLKFRVKNGSSTSWGNFGNDSFVVSRPARRPNLSNYSTAVSTSKSRVAFAAHRVEKFSLKRVRYYFNNELVKTDETVRQVHPPVQ
jgi:hypothetical protein